MHKIIVKYNVRMETTYVLYLVVWIIAGSSTGYRAGTEQRLFEYLFEEYNFDSRPVSNASKIVMVNFGLALNQLLDLDEKNQVLTTAIWVYEEWEDENLVWAPEDYDGLDTLMVPATQVWIPDIFLFNKAGSNDDGFVNVTGSKIVISNSGTIKWMIPIMMKSSCAVDVTYFPYDQQKCHLRFGSWIYDVKQLDIQLKPENPDLSHYLQNSEYDLKLTRLDRIVANSSCCPGDGKHTMIDFHIHMKRKSIYYDYIVIAPTIMLCILTLVTFLLPCHKGEKISIGLTVFLTLYVLQLLIAENVPDTNATPILGVFLFMVMTFNSVSLIMSTFVMNIKKRGDEKQCPDVPRWVLWLCHVVISKIVMTKYAWEECSNYYVGEASDDCILRSPGRQTAQANPSITASSSRASDKNTENASCTTGLLPSNGIEPCSSHNQYHGNNGFSGEKICSSKTTTGNGTAESEGEMANRRLLQSSSDEGRNSEIRYSVSSVVFHSLQMKRQWFYIAEVVDKFSFLIYLISMTISVTMILIVIPIYGQEKME